MLWVFDASGASSAILPAAVQRLGGAAGGPRVDPSLAINFWHTNCVYHGEDVRLAGRSCRRMAAVRKLRTGEFGPRERLHEFSSLMVVYYQVNGRSVAVDSVVDWGESNAV